MLKKGKTTENKSLEPRIFMVHMATDRKYRHITLNESYCKLYFTLSIYEGFVNAPTREKQAGMRCMWKQSNCNNR